MTDIVTSLNPSLLRHWGRHGAARPKSQSVAPKRQFFCFPHGLCHRKLLACPLILIASRSLGIALIPKYFGTNRILSNQMIELLKESLKLCQFWQTEELKKDEDFNIEKDDEELLSKAFDQLDSDHDGIICEEEIKAAKDRNPDSNEAMHALLLGLKGRASNASIDFAEFKRVANITPRVKGQRIEWVRSLNLEFVMAKQLKVGDFFDPLRGIKEMSDFEIDEACEKFSSVLPEKLKESRDKLTKVFKTEDVFQNSKFCTDGSLVGNFGDLDQFYAGPEKLIGSPNPEVLVGMEREHCARQNAEKKFTSTNYQFTTWPALEWEFVFAPRSVVIYPHTPADKNYWRVPTGQKWIGDRGRDIIPLKEFMDNTQVISCKLRKGEVIALRLYTGPMFNLYNAKLRGHPPELYRALEGNEYETTIFCIISGIIKLSKRTEIPKNRRIYRGLGGMILPEQFWTTDRSNGFRGAVELGMMSTTTDRKVAIQYSGRNKKRGTIFEIEAGRIDIGADLKILSQYPGESEYLLPPLSCLEVNGDPRLEGDIVVIPLRVNVCLKGLTLDQLEARRKDLHLALARNLREELSQELSRKLPRGISPNNKV